MSNKSNLLRVTPLMLAALLCCNGASAEISDTIHPFVALGYTYDDNLLRLPENAAGVEQRSDRATQAQVGIIVDRPIGRQRLTGRAKVSRVTFDHFEQLDYNGKDFAANLAWQLGNHLSGNLGADYEQTLTPFSDFHSSERNVRTKRNEHFSGAWRFHPSWQVRGGFVRNEYEYELVTQRFNNRNEDRSEVGFDYLARSGSKVGLVARQLKGSYENPRRINGILLSNDYTQKELKASISWLISGLTQVDVLAGYAKREYESSTTRGSSGANGRITANWVPTGKLRFTGAAWREFSAVESTFYTNSLNKGGSLAVLYSVSAKVQANASVRSETRQFEEVEGIQLDGEREDRIGGMTAGLTWSPTNSIQISATAFRDKRSGTVLLGSSDYRAKGVSLSASGQF